jgi:pimeloyl-ACP methyl ester carboxylesterase
MSDTPRLISHRHQGSRTALVLLHGFGGDPAATWGDFPALLAAEPLLSHWDVHSVGYSTSLAFDVAGIWSADPEIVTLGGLLDSVAGLPPLGQYQALAIIAHSMGGLMLQRALLSSRPLRARVSHVLLFGTPSAGLEKASPFHFWKRQLRDMAQGSAFITTLRQQWTAEITATPPFNLVVIAGDRDEFVPRTSSLDPFPTDRQRVVYGNHFQIVKPGNATHLGFKVAVATLTAGASVGGPFDAARLAVESRDFQRAIQTLGPHRQELDDEGLVTLALALESVGRQGEAIDLLGHTPATGTDPMGVLAGRLKRRWLVERRRADAERARSLYREALALAESKPDPSQAFYHAINCAFMELAYGSDVTAAREFARTALDYCTKSDAKTGWRHATEGEAYLYLGDTQAALAAYRRAVTLSLQPWQASSMYQQAVRAADLTGEDVLVSQLRAVFGQSPSPGLP